MLSGFEPCINCGCDKKPRFIKRQSIEQPIDEFGNEPLHPRLTTYYLVCRECDYYVYVPNRVDDTEQQQLWNKSNNRDMVLSRYVNLSNDPGIIKNYKQREWTIRCINCLQRGYFLNQAKYL